MSNKKTVRKVKKKNPNLRLVKNGDIQPKKNRKRRDKQEKIRFDKSKRIGIAAGSFILLLSLFLGGYYYIVKNYTITTVYVEGNTKGSNFRDLQLMSMCRGLLMSNSAFCYLAALLNEGMEICVEPPH